jgi:hypothetical protein
MTLSTEARVAAAVAVAFTALCVAAIAQEQSEHGTGRATGYGPTNSPGLSQVSLRGSESLSEYGGRGENQLLAQY